jgi:hypothetical protein
MRKDATDGSPLDLRAGLLAHLARPGHDPGPQGALLAAPPGQP